MLGGIGPERGRQGCVISQFEGGAGYTLPPVFQRLFPEHRITDQSFCRTAEPGRIDRRPSCFQIGKISGRSGKPLALLSKRLL